MLNKTETSPEKAQSGNKSENIHFSKRFNIKAYRMLAQATEKELLSYFSVELKKIYGEENVIATENYVFAKGVSKILLCAHLDTVFTSPPNLILYDKEQGLIWSPDGIGGDDRNGVYSIVYLINKNLDNLPNVIFSTKEETGCVGAGFASKELEKEVSGINFAIQIDRQGSNDAVFYQCENKKFIDYICSFGYVETPGSRTDISVYCPKWDIAGVNFSCGYIKNHTKEELVSVKHMFNTIDMIQDILDDNSQEVFKYCGKAKPAYSYGLYSGGYSAYENDYGKTYSSSKKTYVSADDLIAAIYGIEEPVSEKQ